MMPVAPAAFLIAALPLTALAQNGVEYDTSRAYYLPYMDGTEWPLRQGYYGGELDENGRGNIYKNSHEGDLALDFLMPTGTPVLAARAGEVTDSVDTNLFYQACTNDRSICAGRNNLIRIEHTADGSQGEYLHLNPGGSCVEVGDVVSAGDIIGYSGHTGFSFTPHLHFGIRPNLTDLVNPQVYPNFTPGLSHGGNPTPHSFVDVQEFDLYGDGSNLNTGDTGVPRLAKGSLVRTHTSYVSANSANKNWCEVTFNPSNSGVTRDTPKPLPEQYHRYEAAIRYESGGCLETQINMSSSFTTTGSTTTQSLPASVEIATGTNNGCEQINVYGNIVGKRIDIRDASMFIENPAQRWHFTDEGYIKSSIHSKPGELLCLSLEESNANGYLDNFDVKLRVCQDLSRFKWFYDSTTNEISSQKYPREYLTAPAPSSTNKNLRITYRFDTTIDPAWRKFTIDIVSPTLVNQANNSKKLTLTYDEHLRTNLYGLNSDKCLGLDANFQPELQATCEDIEEQKWLYDDLTMQITNLLFPWRDCLAVSSANGQLEIEQCDSNKASQQFSRRFINIPLPKLSDFSSYPGVYKHD